MANHLTFQERQFLYRLKRKGKANPEIAELMGRDRSTIHRELKRNAGQRGYRPKQAQRLADERRLASHRPHKMDDPDVHQYVQDRLEKCWSPEQIAGRVKCDFPRAPARWLSRQTIYDWIDDRASRVAGAVAPRRSAPGKAWEADRLRSHRRPAGCDQSTKTLWGLGRRHDSRQKSPQCSSSPWSNEKVATPGLVASTA